ncbi:TonB-dependent receptor [bacterium]|nr:TonB-dependent receptor [bacterium]
MKRFFIFLVILLLFIPAFAYSKETGSVRGIIKDENNEPLAYTHVDILNTKKRTFSDINGLFVMDKIPTGKQTAKITRIGYRDTLVEFEVHENVTTELVIVLVEEPLMEAKTEQKTPEREIFEREIVVSERILYADEMIGGLPFQGIDALSMSKRLPGVDYLNDYANQPVFRGSSPDQTMILFDRAPLYNPNHLGGLISSFNSETIRNVRVITGGFPAQYGERLGGIIEFFPKNGSMNEFGGSYHVFPLWINGHQEGHVGSKTSFIFAERTTFVELLPFHLYDLWGKIHIEPTRGMKNDLGAFVTYDEFNTEETLSTGIQYKETNLDWGSQLYYFNTQLLIGGKMISYLSFSSSDFGVKLDETNYGAATIFSDSLEDITIKGDFEYFAPSDHLVGFGLKISNLNFSYYHEDAGLIIQEDSGHETDIAVYCQDKFDIGEKLTLEPGLRMTYLTEGSYFLLSPRLRGRYFVNENLALKAGWGLHHQYLHGLLNELFYFPFDLWVFSKDEEPAQSNSVILSLEQWLGKDYSFTVEGWWTGMNGIVKRSETYGELFITGEGEAKGLEFFIKRSRGNPRGWISYTLLDSKREFEGESYAAHSDRRHNFQFIMALGLSKSWELGLGYRLASGLPNLDYDPEHPEYMPERYPTYSRTDLAISWRKKWGDFSIQPYIEIVNLLGHKNVSGYSGADEGFKERLFLGASPLPLFGIKGRF